MNKTEIQRGSKIVFGKYQHEQIKMNPMVLSWTVLDICSESVLLLCDALIDYMPYHIEEGAITWKECSLRKWLNGDFIRSAFTADEVSMLTLNVLPEDPGVLDQVFILSREEVEKYLSGEKELDEKGILVIPARSASILGESCESEKSLDSYWWLRSSNGVDMRFGEMIEHVNHNGFFGTTPSYCERWVRPACRISL